MEKASALLEQLTNDVVVPSFWLAPFSRRRCLVPRRALFPQQGLGADAKRQHRSQGKYLLPAERPRRADNCSAGPRRRSWQNHSATPQVALERGILRVAERVREASAGVPKQSFWSLSAPAQALSQSQPALGPFPSPNKGLL
eukprot:scaffold48_cov311-Pinguiococcus_pyrenoidosus.AAC.265